MSPPRGKRARDFLVDNAIVAVTQVLLKLRGLLALPLIVKSLGTEGYGLWVQVLSVITFGSAFLGASLHIPLVRFVAGKSAEPREVYATTLLWTLVLGCVGGMVLGAAAGPLSGPLLGGPESVDLLRASALLILLSNIRILNINLFRATGRFMARSAIDFASTMLELAGILVVLRAGYGLREAVFFMVAWNALVAIGTTALALHIVGLSMPSAALARRAFVYAAPLLPGVGAMWVIDRADRFVIGRQLGAREVGIYSAAYALGALVLHYQVPFQVTLLPRVAELWDTDRQRAKRYIELCSKVFLALAIPTVAGLHIAAPLLLRSLANQEIAAKSAAVATIVGVGILVQGLTVMQAQVFHGANRTGATAVALIAGAVVNVAATLWLVPMVGVIGAAIATVAGYGALWIIQHNLARKLLAIDNQPLFILKSIAASAAMVGVLHLVAPRGLAAFLATLVPSVAVYFGALWVLRAISAEERAMITGALSRSRP